ncbi:MAG TPA: 3-deoxy-7-phosphoheptulonate synthase [Thermoanaerobaculia bacterium]|nr:3-deoxy-7-phosphoheptulonate synthase [Thermoanaerobaculia bacterium]
MVIIMNKGAGEEEIAAVSLEVRNRGFGVHRSDGAEQTVLGIAGEVLGIDPRTFESLPGVQEVVLLTEPYKLASLGFRRKRSVIRVGEIEIGGPEVVIMAGPCTIEGEEQLYRSAESVAKAGARILRGGAFKPRTSPYSFQGPGIAGLELLRRVGDEMGMATISEVMEAGQIEPMLPFVDILQVGTRNMQNYNLLAALGKVNRPVLLKRGMSATVQEWLLAAEYIMAGGNHDVILCERGIRTFETSLRNTLDLSAVPMVQSLSHLPVIVDPSHATGRRDMVTPLARAAVAVGADGLLIEVHHDPDAARCDGPQSLRPAEFASLMGELRLIVQAVGRRVSEESAASLP